MERFGAAWGSAATLRPNYAEVVVETLPIETPIDSPIEQRRIELASGLRTGAIKNIQWIKQIEKRKEGQRHAHAIFSMDSREDANELLTGRVVVQGQVLRAKKNNPDPKRCAKCNTLGHIAECCKVDNDTCVRCAGKHRTSTCQVTDQQLFCTNCRKAGHGAASRDCPVFQGKLRERSKWDAERNYRLFVTKDPNTWGRMNEPVQEDFNQRWRAKVSEKYNEWTTVQRGKGRGRLAGGEPGEGGGNNTWKDPGTRTPTPDPDTGNRGQSRGP
ncbi:hypothetical protein F5050DRAFT_1581920 [Lentinula boryana]|uniref:CCHC-type domain-containing protein n=1 Tax=Lentinula boryana TaxID=40481 RepID=A0ABQ8PXJ0_9AGAR|nr:hypothetical protein F5050DRAFT_1581920 [Lentinula boryana]